MSAKSNLPRSRQTATGTKPPSRTGASQRDEPRHSDEQRRESATRRAPKESPGGLGAIARGGYAEHQPRKAVSPAGSKAGKKRT